MVEPPRGPGRRATSWATIAAVALKAAVRDPVGPALAWLWSAVHIDQARIGGAPVFKGTRRRVDSGHSAHRPPAEMHECTALRPPYAPIDAIAPQMLGKPSGRVYASGAPDRASTAILGPQNSAHNSGHSAYRRPAETHKCTALGLIYLQSRIGRQSYLQECLGSAANVGCIRRPLSVGVCRKFELAR